MRYAPRSLLVLATLLALFAAGGVRIAYGATYTVDTTSDASLTACTAADNDCSLRGAIGNANGTAAADIINFDIGPGTPEIDVGSGTGGSALPVIIYPLTIRGNTGGATRVFLNGILTTTPANADGLYFSSGAGMATVQNLVISNFDGDGIDISFVSAGGNTIQGNYIGTNAAGTVDAGNGGVGIRVAAPDNIIGGQTPTLRNVISGNNSDGVLINGNSATGNVVLGNYIGTNAGGNAGVPPEN